MGYSQTRAAGGTGFQECVALDGESLMIIEGLKNTKVPVGVLS